MATAGNFILEMSKGFMVGEVHSDGMDIANNLKTLTNEEVLILATLADISYLGPTFDSCSFYDDVRTGEPVFYKTLDEAMKQCLTGYVALKCLNGDVVDLRSANED